MQWHAVAMRLSASHHHVCSPVGETNFLLGLKPAVGAVPVVAMYLRLQTIVNVTQKSHSEHIHLLLAGLPGEVPLSTIEKIGMGNV